MVATKRKLFQFGRVLATPGALRSLEEIGVAPIALLCRHLRMDWGDCCEEDAKLNDEALLDGSRIMSVYKLAGRTFWVITEAQDDSGKRAATTILLPEEY